MGYPSLGTWNERQPPDAEADAVLVAERLAWAAIEHCTAGRIAFAPITVRPIVVENDGGIRLQGPVGGIQWVKINGTLFSAWRLDGTALMRMDAGSWDVNDDLTLAVATLEVSYWQGWRPGRMLVWAAGELASEFYKASSGDRKTRLPKGVTSVVRQGVSFEIQKPLFTDGQTGIHEIDVVLARYNPQGAIAQTTIASPETLARAPRRY